MQYEFWESANGNSPVRRGIEELRKMDLDSAGKLARKLDLLSDYSFDQLRRTKLIKKVKGKIWELRFDLKNKTCRIFFVVNFEGIMCFLYFIIKKDRKLKGGDVAIAEERSKNIF